MLLSGKAGRVSPNLVFTHEDNSHKGARNAACFGWEYRRQLNQRIPFPLAFIQPGKFSGPRHLSQRGIPRS